MNVWKLREDVVLAVRECCTQAGEDTWIWVGVDESCVVPSEFVRDGAIALDITDDAVAEFEISQGVLSFYASFGNDPTDVLVAVPLSRIGLVGPATAPTEGVSFRIMETPAALKSKVEEMKRPAETEAEKPAAAATEFRRPMRIK